MWVLYKTCVNYALWARPARPRGAPRAGVQRVVDQLVAVRAEDLAARGAAQPARTAADGERERGGAAEAVWFVEQAIAFKSQHPDNTFDEVDENFQLPQPTTTEEGEQEQEGLQATESIYR